MVSVLITCVKRPFSALGLLLIWMVPAMAMADCKLDYQQAERLLTQSLSEADGGKHPDLKNFEQQFGALIDRLVSARCHAELLSLYQLVETEKKIREQETAPHEPTAP